MRVPRFPRQTPERRLPMRTLLASPLLALLVVTPALAGDAAKKKAPGKGEAISIAAGEVKWGDAPPDLPKGAQLAVLHGDPSKKAVFTVRLRMPDGYKIPPHWHTNDEQLTILSGTFLLSMGDSFDAATAHSLSTGAFHFLPGKMHHAAATKGETIVEIHGVGPFDIH